LPLLSAQRLERAARVRDGDELPRPRAGDEVVVERERLDRRPGLAADDEQCVSDAGPLDGEHGRRIGAVEDDEGVGEAGEVVPLRQRRARRVDPAQAAHPEGKT